MTSLFRGVVSVELNIGRGSSALPLHGSRVKASPSRGGLMTGGCLGLCCWECFIVSVDSE
jgi:hypothetical protein